MRGGLHITVAVVGLLAVAMPAAAQFGKFKDKDTLIDDKSLRQWVAELKDKDPGARTVALQAVAAYGPAARKEFGAVKEIITLLADRDPAIRVNAGIALGIIGMNEDDRKEGIDGLRKMLSDSQQIVRFQGVQTLELLGHDAKPAIPELRRLLITERQFMSWEIRRASAGALAAAGVEKDSPNSQAVKALTDALYDSCVQVQLEALAGLQKLGPPRSVDERKSTVTVLNQRMSRGRDKRVLVWLYLVQMRYEKVSEKYLTKIAELMKDSDVTVRNHATRAMGIIGPEAKAHVPDLIKALSDKNDYVVMWAITALERIGPAAKGAVPELQEVNTSKKRNESIKAMAAAAIFAINNKNVAKPEKDKPLAKPEPKKESP
jgi:HEAT repeat protein